MTFSARLDPLRSAFAHRDFRLFTGGTAISNIGTWVQRMSVGWLAWELTHSGTWLGIIAFADMFPTVLLAPITGAVADRVDRLRALRAVRVPSILVTIVSMTYRYLFVLADEAHRMLRARQSRSASAGGQSGGSIAWRGRVTGNMAGSLFVRSLDRSDRIYQAMLARGYDGTVRRVGETPTAGRLSVAVAALAFAVLAAIAVAARMPV